MNFLQTILSVPLTYSFGKYIFKTTELDADQLDEWLAAIRRHSTISRPFAIDWYEGEDNKACIMAIGSKAAKAAIKKEKALYRRLVQGSRQMENVTALL